ncbi:MAG TPA: DapH/DapD/GlmU-related protein, partial [Edaphobacter sp.]|nr:DapH/DapD/GlmU-related protein [Edaphobacter sp.]
HKTIIGDNVFVGSDSTLVAPLTIESDSYIAAGSCITESVPAGSLALARSRQTLKQGWTERKRQRGR